MKRLYLLLAPLLVLLALELLLALVNVIYPWDELVHRIGMSYSKFIVNQEFEKHAQFYRDADLFWRIIPNSGKNGRHVNSLGFRGPEFKEEKDSSTIRIFTMGNSCTFGGDIDLYEQTYAGIVQSKLNDLVPNQNIEVINAGIDGYSTYQMYQYWRKTLRQLHPDIITIYAAFNDLIYSPFREDKHVRLSAWGCTISNLLSKSRLIRFVFAAAKRILLMITGDKFVSTYNSEEGILRRVAPDDYRQNLIKMIEETKRNNVNIIFMTSPYVTDFPLSLLPYPEVIEDGDEHKIIWEIQDQVDARWIKTVKPSNASNAVLQQALRHTEEHPDWPVPYFKAAHCYQCLGDSNLARKYYHLADSLNFTAQDHSFYNSIMRDVAREFEIPLIDCELRFAPESTADLFISDGIHPNEKGHALIADELLSELVDIIRNRTSLAD